MTHCWPL